MARRKNMENKKSTKRFEDRNKNKASNEGDYSMKPPLRQNQEKDEDFGKFANNFSLRMMEKMQYVWGEGLGKYNQGMINPVAVYMKDNGPVFDLSSRKTIKERFKILKQQKQHEKDFMKILKIFCV